MPLGFTFNGGRNCRINGRTVAIAEFTTTAKLCPNYPAGLVVYNDNSEKVHRTGRLKLTLVPQFASKNVWGYSACSTLTTLTMPTDFRGLLVALSNMHVARNARLPPIHRE